MFCLNENNCENKLWLKFQIRPLLKRPCCGLRYVPLWLKNVGAVHRTYEVMPYLPFRLSFWSTWLLIKSTETTEKDQQPVIIQFSFKNGTNKNVWEWPISSLFLYSEIVALFITWLPRRQIVIFIHFFWISFHSIIRMK